MELTPDQLARAEQIKAQAIEKGYPELQSDYLGKVAVTMFEGWGGSVVWDYNIWHEGKVENPAKGEGLEVKAKDVPFMVYALNRMVELGVPVNLIYTHYGEDSLGVIAAARLDEEKNVCRTAMVVAWPYDEQLRTGQCRLSAGLSGVFKDEQYTEGKTVDYWPINWAIIPPDGIPAMPPGEVAIAAGNKVPVSYWNFAATNQADGKANGKGGVDMTPEEVQALIDKATDGLKDQITELSNKNSELESQLSSIKEENTALKEKVAAQDNAIAEPQVEAKLKDVMSRALPGKRAKIKEQVDGADGPAAKLAILNTLSLALPDDFKDYGDPEIRKELGASVHEKPEGEGEPVDEQEQRVDTALALMEQEPEKYDSIGVALQAVANGIKPKKEGE